MKHPNKNGVFFLMGKTQRKEKSLSYIFFFFARPPAQKIIIFIFEK